MAETKKKAGKRKAAAKPAPDRKKRRAAAKPASKAEKAPPKKRERRQRDPEALRQHNQRMSIILFACALFVGFLVFVEGESVWRFLHNVLLGLFGASAILWPIFLLYVAVVTALERVSGRVRTKMWLSVLIVVLFCSAIYIFRSEAMPDGVSYWKTLSLLYGKGVDKESVGLVSGILGYPVVAVFGGVGAKIFIVLVLFVAVMLLTGTSLVQLFRVVTKPASKMKESVDAARERRAADLLARDIDIPLGPEDEGPRRHAQGDTVLPVAPPAAAPQQARNEKLERLQKVFGIPDPQLDEDLDEGEEPEPAPPVRHGAPPPIESDVKVEDVLAAQKKGQEAAPAPAQPVQTTMYIDVPPQDGEYHFPPISMLEASKHKDAQMEAEELKTNGHLLIETLKSFGVQAKILDISRGPSVTRYELQPAAGVKISKITNLADDLAMNLAASGVRIEAPIPGKAAVGIEVPNKHKSAVRMRDIVESNAFAAAKGRLTVTLGRDIAGQVVVADLSKMPHLLIAGTTGSGKSVCVNSFIISILYKATPKEVKLLMIDPKVVELRIYNGIPHLLVPVVTDPRKAAGALNWAVGEMMSRYKIFADYNVRDLSAYNKLARSGELCDEEGNKLEEKPQIVIIIDELSDLMMAAPNEVEDAICRLAQLARAAGIHLVVATQRPSVDVITGLIKANIPSRIALTVASLVDSRTILDVGGAEKLLGNGDMLFAPVGALKPLRVQGCYVSDEEIESIVNFVKKTQEHQYDESIQSEIEKNAAADPEKTASDEDEFEDPMMAEAIRCVVEAGQASTSLLQRRLRLGYARAGRLIDQMEQAGVVGPHEGSKPRQVLLSYQQWLERNMQQADRAEPGDTE